MMSKATNADRSGKAASAPVVGADHTVIDSETRDSYQLLQDFRKTQMAADFYKQRLHQNISQIHDSSKHPNLLHEEKLLLNEYQDYMEGIRLQQDKILRTVSYPLSIKDVSAQRIEERPNDNQNIDIIARNRKTDDTTDCEETTYTLRLQPKLYSFRFLCQTDKPEDIENVEVLRDMIFKIRENPDHGAHILRYFVDYSYAHLKGDELQRIQELHTKFIMNFSNLFYGDLYLEDKNSLSKKNIFILTFQQFMKKELFQKDKAGNVVIVNKTTMNVIKVLFEGQSRKMSANNFLRHIYTPNFSKIFISQIQESIIKMILHKIKRDSRTSRMTNSSSNLKAD